MMKIATSAFVGVGLLLSVGAVQAGELADACTKAASTGAIDLPEGMTVEQAGAVCACMDENSNEAVAAEFLESLSIKPLEERMSSIGEEATAIFNSCAS